MDWKDWQDKIVIGFKSGILLVLGWAGKELVKKIKPTWKSIKKFGTHGDELILLRAEIDTIKKLTIEKGVQIDQHLFVIDSTIEALIKTSTDPMYLLDEKGYLIMVNNAWLKITGFSDPKDSYGRNYMQAIVASDRQEMKELADMRAISDAPAEGEVSFKHLMTGQITHVSFRSEKITLDIAGKVFRFIGRLKILEIIQ